MPKEIERKFIVDLSLMPELPPGEVITQGYISKCCNTTVRVRTYGTSAFLTVKGPTVGFTCPEYEYEIPFNDALEMLAGLCGKLIKKTRHKIVVGDRTWEIDVFSWDNEGLVVGEVELESEDDILFFPNWVVREVTGKPQYYNSSLADVPYSSIHFGQ